MKLRKTLALFPLLLGAYPVFSQNWLGIDPGKIIYNFRTSFPHQAQHPIAYIISYALIGILLIILDQVYKRNFPASLQSFFRWNIFSSQVKQSNQLFKAQSIIYATLSLLINSYVFYIGLQNFFKFCLFGLILSFVLQGLLNLITAIVIDKLFNEKEISNLFFNINLKFWTELTELSYIFLVLISLAVSPIIKGVITIVWIIIWLGFYFNKLLMYLKTFSEAKFHLFYFILYLCAVEFMPFLLIFTVFK